jgi:FkbM family methyltransferase
VRHLVRLFKAVRTLGIINGCNVYFYYFFYRWIGSKKWASRMVKLPRISRPMWIRPGVSDWIVLERIFLDEEYDPKSQCHDASMDRLKTSMVSSGKIPLIIDCGANVGLSSVWFSERFPETTVIAIEPEARNFDILALNAKAFPNIIPMKAAVSDRKSRVRLLNDTETPWAWRTQEAELGSVATVTIPDAVRSNDRYSLFIVKIDIEGFEVNLFRQETEWVDDVPLLIFEMHDWMRPWSGCGNAIFSALTRKKRDYLVRGENVFSYSHAALTIEATDLQARQTDTHEPTSV